MYNDNIYFSLYKRVYNNNKYFSHISKKFIVIIRDDV